MHIPYPRDRFKAMERLAVRGGERRQTAQLGKRVGEVMAVGIDNRDPYVLVVGVEEEKVGAHTTPVALSVLVGDRESIV